MKNKGEKSWEKNEVCDCLVDGGKWKGFGEALEFSPWAHQTQYTQIWEKIIEKYLDKNAYVKFLQAPLS